METTEPQTMYWLQTYTGKKIDLINPTREMVDIEDIAHALSMICRFNGHCRDFYSVAEHSVMVEVIGNQISLSSEPISDFQRLALLLHDAAEAYIGDFTTPLKRGLDSIGNNPSPEKISKIAELERRWLVVIGQAFFLGSQLAEPSFIMRQADDRALAVEVPTLFHPVQSCWWETRNRPRSGEMMIHCWSPAEARRQFLSRFRVLYETLHSRKIGWEEVGGVETKEDGPTGPTGRPNS